MKPRGVAWRRPSGRKGFGASQSVNLLTDGAALLTPKLASALAPHRAAFVGIYVFTLLLYARPNDLFPGLLGEFPLAKIVAIIAPLAYFSRQISSGEPLVRWTLEIKMVLLISLLGVLWMPAAASPKDSMDTLTDPFLKAVTIFVLMVNVINTRERLCSLWKLVIISGTVLATFAIRSYLSGQFTMRGLRIEGLVNGMFGNPNDLAAALDMLLPFAVVLGLMNKGKARIFYLVCAFVMAFGIIATFSRGGFLGLLATGGVLLWKLGRGQRFKTIFTTVFILGILLAATPGGYGSRLSSIFDNNKDKTGSAQERRQLMERAFEVFMRRPVVGVGMGNFHIYSIREKEAHNAYLEIAAELGVMGLIAYLIVIFAPFRSLRRIEEQTTQDSSEEGRQMRYLSVAIQAALVAYIVCSFFASIQYLWYLYYTVGYGVALRFIYAAETQQAVVPNNSLVRSAWPTQATRRTGRGKGMLWQSAPAHGKSSQKSPQPIVNPQNFRRTT